ncbi:Or22c family protein [Megaselia abdita]
MVFKVLSNKLSIEEQFFKIPEYSLRHVGCWPEIVFNWKAVLWSLGHFLFLSFGAYGETVFGLVKIADLTLALETFCPAITKQVTVIKMLIFLFYRKDMKRLVLRLKELITAQKADEERLQIGQNLASTAGAYSMFLYYSAHSTMMFFFFKPIVINLYKMAVNEDTIRDLPFRMFLPKQFIESQYYYIVFCLVGYSGWSTVYTFVGVDSFFVTFCLYMSALFRFIQYDVEKALSDLPQNDFQVLNYRQRQHYKKKLAKIIENHNDVIHLSSDFSSLFAVIVLGHFLSAALILCVSIMVLLLSVESLGFGAVLYTSYCICTMFQLFVYCYGGTEITENSLEISKTVYQTDWYKCDVETQKMLLLIMLRSQRAVTVKAPFFSPSLPAFQTIMSSTGSYIALLKSFL